MLSKGRHDSAQDRSEGHRVFISWVKAIRLQFHPMAFLAYSLGCAAALQAGSTFHATLFWLGYASVFLIEVGSVLFNELYDQETDRLNANRSPFSGGSGVLVEGDLLPGAVRITAWGCLAVTMGLGVFAALLPGAPSTWKVGCYLAMGFILGPGYTAPPLKLSARGLGELNVGFTHSLYLIGFGHMLQSGAVLTPEVTLLSAPVFFSVLSAICLAALPDLPADKAAGKGTLAVRLGPKAVTTLAAASTALSVAAIGLLAVDGLMSHAAAALFALFSGGHGLVLMACILRIRRRCAYGKRIDVTMQIALSHILWTVGFPLAVYLT